MINTQIYLNNIKSALTSLSWTSPDGSGSTSFVSIYTYPVWENEYGFPYLVLLDNPQASQNQTSEDYEIINNIEFHICANWAVNTQTTDPARREECMLRIREAYDALREYLSLDSNIATWLTSPTSAVRGSHSNLTWRSDQLQARDENIDELNLYRRIITLPISDIVNV